MRWYVKAAVQFLLSKTPGGVGINDWLSSKFGEQEKFENHTRDRILATLPIFSHLQNRMDLDRRTVALEIGTGWAPVVPLTLRSLGVGRVITTDLNRYLKKDNLQATCATMLTDNVYCDAPEAWRESLGVVVRDGQTMTLEVMLEKLGFEYAAPSDATCLPYGDQTFDLSVTNLVLTHIPRDALSVVLAELFRVTKPGGLTVHRIRMSDEFTFFDPSASDVNFLKYSSRFWNSFMNTRIKYLNRVRCSEYKNAFESAGFSLVDSSEQVSESGIQALKTMKLAPEFRDFEPEDLATDLMLGVWRKPS